MVEGEPIAAENIQVPVFAVGTEKDHVAPWKSVYKIHLMANSDITFVLTSGGHNAGIVSEPGRPGHYYHIHERKGGEAYLAPSRWLEKAEKRNDSWWQAWHDWLIRQDTPKRVSPPYIDKAMPSAPGIYVLQK